jgi:putative mycofactocin binding protein MftB
VSTEFDLDAGWCVHPKVSIRPERFGALLYHFDTRKLSFLKSPTILAVVQALDEAPSARAACAQAGIAEADLGPYARALSTLADSQTICRRSAA